MNTEQIVAEVARKTGVRLSPGDPVLTTAAINEVILDQALARSDGLLKAQADRITAASAQAVADAETHAARLMTDAGSWLEARFKASGDAAAASVLAALQHETKKAEKARRVAVRAAWVATFVAAVTASACGGMVLAGLR